MSVSYSVPMQRSAARARRMLFTPFAFEKWIVLGFAAFVSEWLAGGWGHNSFVHKAQHGARIGADVALRMRHALEMVAPWWPLIGVILIVGVAVAILFQWLGSRGKFVFLDDVVRERTAISEPWRTYAREGMSLFVFRLLFWMAMVPLVLVALLPVLDLIRQAIHGEMPSCVLSGSVLLSALLLVIIGLGGAFLMLLLDDFVTPLMYRHRLTVGEAWHRFSPLFSREWPAFVLYALIVLVMLTVLRLLIVVVGFATCCVGFVLMGAPYVGQVVLLPVYVFFRGLGPEFLAQFGPEYDLFASAAPAAPAPAAPPPPAAPAPGA